MARKLDEAAMKDAARTYLAGATLEEMGKRVGRTADVVSVYLREAGVQLRRAGQGRRPHNALELPGRELSRRHTRGESVNALAEQFGVSRAVVHRHLVAAGVTPRGRGAAMLERMRRTSAEERFRLTQAAHEAVRGRKKPDEEKRRIAQAKGRLRGPGEAVLAVALRQRGHEVEEQAALDVYNVDLLVTGVAVEPRCSSSNPMRDPQRRRRTEHLLRLGVPTLWVCYRNLDALHGCLEQVIAHLDEMRGQPSALRQYRVIRCHAQRFTIAHDKLGQFSAVLTPVRHECRRVE